MRDGVRAQACLHGRRAPPQRRRAVVEASARVATEKSSSPCGVP
ncbi:hypothetical protein AKJ09_02807 [Labilithrix luteola]|uniref:Uncharacterized protein n=1 Tax=Labilithrix luteola TaxID=1391654 RepID=A0A0K1PRI5_9BACT|nr:hypothetical protein AKJ09_02807 [Labilithrix luteola]